MYKPRKWKRFVDSIQNFERSDRGNFERSDRVRVDWSQNCERFDSCREKVVDCILCQLVQKEILLSFCRFLHPKPPLHRL